MLLVLILPKTLGDTVILAVIFGYILISITLLGGGAYRYEIRLTNFPVTKNSIFLCVFLFFFAEIPFGFADPETLVVFLANVSHGRGYWIQENQL